LRASGSWEPSCGEAGRATAAKSALRVGEERAPG
jgi:hypothetical protein